MACGSRPLRSRGAVTLYQLLLALAGAICWGLAPIAGKVGLSGVEPLTGMALRTFMASALVFGFMAGAGAWGHLNTVPFRAWLPILVEAILATLAGDLAYYVALKHGSASTVALVMSGSPLVTVMAAALWLGEPLSWPKVLGAILIVAGIALVSREMA